MEDIRKKVRVLTESEIIRNKLKHLSTITNKLKNEVNIMSKSSQVHESVAVQRTGVREEYLTTQTE